MKTLHTFRLHHYEDVDPLEYMGEGDIARMAFEGALIGGKKGGYSFSPCGEFVVGEDTPMGEPFYYCFNSFDVYAVYEEDLSLEEKQVIENFELCL